MKQGGNMLVQINWIGSSNDMGRIKWICMRPLMKCGWGVLDHSLLVTFLFALHLISYHGTIQIGFRTMPKKEKQITSELLYFSKKTIDILNETHVHILHWNCQANFQGMICCPIANTVLCIPWPLEAIKMSHYLPFDQKFCSLNMALTPRKMIQAITLLAAAFSVSFAAPSPVKSHKFDTIFPWEFFPIDQ